MDYVLIFILINKIKFWLELINLISNGACYGN